MMNLLLLKSCFFFAVVGLFLQFVLTFNINNTAEEDINGQYLLDIGVKTNDPLLQAVGHAIMNHRHHRCDDWTSWSSCTADARGKFGLKERKRTCDNEKENTEKDFSICRQFCPSDYDKTTNGFCVKLHKSLKSRDDADNQCKSEGGYLINIDSALKYKDISNLKVLSLSKYFYIDGLRKDTNSPWMFEYGNKSGYFNWAPREPGNGSDQLCLVIQKFDKLMYDGPCQESRNFLCEISM